MTPPESEYGREIVPPDDDGSPDMGCLDPGSNGRFVRYHYQEFGDHSGCHLDCLMVDLF